MKIPDFKHSVANKVIKESGLEGKVTPEKLAEVAQKGGHDVKNKGYISGDEFKAAAKAFKAEQDAPSAGTNAPTGQTFSPLLARTAVIAPKADMGNPDVAFIKTRTLANVGDGKRFGALDAGHGLRAFTVDESMLTNINDDKLKKKLNDLGPGTFFGVLTTDDSPELLLGKVVGGEAKVGGSINLRYRSAAKVLGAQDTYKAVADAFGKAPQIDLGGEDPNWSLGSSDWASGAKFADIQAARSATQQAAVDPLAGPTTLDGFKNVATHKHTAAEKKALLATVKAGAGEDKTFPNPDESYYGLHTYLMEGPAAAHAVAFAQANMGGAVDYDPAKHSVIVTIKSFDEAQVGTFVIDRKTQEVLFDDESNSVDYNNDAVTAFFPKADLDGMFDAFVIGTLATRGEHLGVVAGDDTPDNMDFADWLEDAISG